MTAAVAATRGRHQAQVETLLAQIRAGAQELQRLKAYGVRGRGLAERKRELARVREQLAALVATPAPSATVTPGARHGAWHRHGIVTAS